jgi:SAM-dependent methyltransferase/GNAT superfamily N-acetyltransferase
MAGEVVVRLARPSDARAIAEVSVASRRWSYRDQLTEGDLEALSVEKTTADFAQGLDELPGGAAVYVAQRAARVVGYAYVLPSPDEDVPAQTSELGSIYVTEDVAGSGVAQALLEASVAHARAAGHDLLTLWVRAENGRARRFYEKCGLQPDGRERSRPHDVLPIEMHEIRYRLSLERPGPQGEGSSAFWESEARNWIAWARTPGHDSYWEYSPAFFRDIVPKADRRTLEVGCGEGRVTRDLERLGHPMVSVDASPSLIQAAHESHAGGRYIMADAARLPFADGSYDLVVAYNSLMDMDDMPGAVREAARVLGPGSRLCICVTHPIADAGKFARKEADAPFVIEGDYLNRGFFDETVQRAGLTMRFRGLTHSIESYARALEDAGLVIERLREPAQRDDVVASEPAEARWQRIPNFLFIRALKPRTD